MIALVRRWFARGDAVLSEARPPDAAALSGLHAKSFQRGWSEAEFERLLLDRSVMVDRAAFGRDLVGFIMSRRAADEAEILSVAVAAARRGRGLAGRLLMLHLRKLAARRLYRRAGFREVGRRAAYYRPGSASQAAALVLRRDLA